MAVDMPCVGGGTPLTLFRDVISVDLSLPLALPCLPPRIASKQEQQLPIALLIACVWIRDVELKFK